MKLTRAAIFHITYQGLLLIILPFYFYYTPPKISMILAAVILFALTEISLTAGYHRLWSHRTYQPNKVVEAILLFLSTMTMQSSVLDWANNHRYHHRFTDKEGDPHSIKKGFWYAHIFWLFEDPKPIDESMVHDLMQNKLLRFQQKYYFPLAIGTNLIATLFVGWLLKDFLGAFILSWWTRMFFTHHITFFVNSWAHTWGTRTFSKEETAVNNFILALVTFGEGYHNYHHVFSSDYRNGARWYHFDPTKWLVWTLNKAGLANNLKRVSFYTARKRIILEDKKLLLEKIHSSTLSKRESLEQPVHQVSEGLLEKISQLNARLQQYRQDKTNSQMLREEIRALRKSIRNEWKSWLQLSQTIMSL